MVNTSSDMPSSILFRNRKKKKKIGAGGSLVSRKFDL